MSRRLAFALALPMAALAQIQVSYIPASGSPQILTSGTQCAVGTFAAGETTTLQFQIQNETGVPVVNLVNVQPPGSFIVSPPAATPGTPNAYGFAINFMPPGPPSAIQPEYQSLLTVDSFSVLLVAQAVGMPTVGDAAGDIWLPGDIIAFPHTQVGQSVVEHFTLTNPYPSSIVISSFSVTGAAFQSSALTVPLTLAANQTQPFQITFAPTLPDTNTGSLIVNGQAFNLSGEGFQPALPAATIEITGATGSAQQPTLAIQLASAAPAAGEGTLTMAFTPASGMPDDPAIQFVDNNSRTVSVQVKQGDSVASCGSGPDCKFQTGTTAGTISFTLSLGTQATQTSVNIAPAPVSFDTKTATVQGSGIDVTLDGFDNTHSASNLSFTFKDVNGKEISGGVIPVDASTEFTQFFSANAAKTGGLFQLQANFPVTGDISQIGAVSVTATNSAGTSSPVQIPITE